MLGKAPGALSVEPRQWTQNAAVRTRPAATHASRVDGVCHCCGVSHLMDPLPLLALITMTLPKLMSQPTRVSWSLRNGIFFPPLCTSLSILLELALLNSTLLGPASYGPH